MSENYPTADYESATSYLNIIFYTFIVAVSVVVTLGNFVVIVAMISQKSLRTPPHIYLGSLALIDLSVGVFILPLRIHQVMNDNQWKFGASLCGIYVTADVTLCTLSIYHLIAIAVDRYRAITQGVTYVQRRSFTMVTITIAFLWVVSLWVSTPPFLGWHDEDWGLQSDKETNTYFCAYTKNKGYVFHSALGTFILPTAIIIILYYRIFTGIQAKLRKRALPVSMGQAKSVGETSDTCSSEDILEQNVEPSTRSKSIPKRIKFRLTKIRRSILPTSTSVSVEAETSEQRLEVTHSSDTNNTGMGSGCSTANTSTKSILRQQIHPLKPRPMSQVEEFVRKKIKFSLTRERRAAKTLGVIVIAYIICWLPFCITYLTDAFLFPLTHTVWFEVCSWMGYVNSGMNPFIYSILNRDFRAGFSKILFCYKK